jgi:hypothetical protein
MKIRALLNADNIDYCDFLSMHGYSLKSKIQIIEIS